MNTLSQPYMHRHSPTCTVTALHAPSQPYMHQLSVNGSCVSSLGKEQNDLDEILRELLGEAHSTTGTSTVTKTTKKVVDGGDDAYTRERQQYHNPDGSTTTIEKRRYKAPNVTENVTINKVGQGGGVSSSIRWGMASIRWVKVGESRHQ